MPQLCIVYPGICMTTDENHGKPESGYSNGARLFSAESNLFCLLGHRRRWPRLACCPLPPFVSRQATGSPLGQLKYLPCCRTGGFHTSANFESKISVRALMWSASSGTPKSSCICLLLTYQGSPFPSRKHLDFNTSNFRTWVRAADLHAGHALSIMGRMSCFYSRTPFLTDRSLIIQKGSQHTHSLSSPFLTWSRYLGSPQITSSVDPLNWFPEEIYWSGLDKALSGTRENYRGAFTDFNGDSPFTQQPLKVVEL